ncbi:unnamed protein product [Eruca vesicaria subsp. sativa]|uniref:Oberon coiled-coil region domain-containing protein n=1 Tax=Eruca vesicaria subsp. sativa TaxID=29727 RepID=A0ABC8J771_ERUVS|nr:unnamed protein product [Eruca vesicaria subsp. sativa]
MCLCVALRTGDLRLLSRNLIAFQIFFVEVMMEPQQRLCLKETEERRRSKLEELKKFENSHFDYRNMKLRMESEIAGLLKRFGYATATRTLAGHVTQLEEANDCCCFLLITHRRNMEKEECYRENFFKNPSIGGGKFYVH